MPRRILVLLIPLALAGCINHSHATKFNGTTGIRGVPIEYQTTTSWSLRAVFFFNLLGVSSKNDVIGAFTQEAAARGSNRVRISQTSSSTYWYIFPPLSFFFHPTVTTVEGDIEGGAVGE